MTSVQPTLSQALGDYLALRRARYARATVQNESFVLRRFIASVGTSRSGTCAPSTSRPSSTARTV